MQLPQKFLDRLRALPGDVYSEYLKQLDCPPYRALRLNPLKCEQELREKIATGRRAVPFCPDAYYLAPDEKLGTHPYHHAGVFYLQEPSATLAAEALEVTPGEIVLDLCAAPGGKATQLAGRLAGKGLIWCNEYVLARSRALLSNLERLGVANAVVTSLSSEALAERLPQFFDKILVDAPCSGEGMMRKEPAAVTGWSEENIRLCAARQREILDSAALMLKPGGRLCYSTCTFAPEENELQIAEFLRSHPDFQLVAINNDYGTPGFSQLVPNGDALALTRRIFPADGGEGHFVALLEKKGESVQPMQPTPYKSDNPIFDKFYEDNFEGSPPGNVVTVGDRVYITPNFQLPSCPILRCGILAGTMHSGRFVPEHGLFASPVCDPRQVLNLTLDDPRTAAFLHGEEIDCDSTLKGFAGVLIEGVPLSFGKASGGRLKNHYPKGLRSLN